MPQDCLYPKEMAREGQTEQGLEGFRRRYQFFFFDTMQLIAYKIDGIGIKWRGLDALRLVEPKVARLKQECDDTAFSTYVWSRLVHKLLCQRWGRKAMSRYETWRCEMWRALDDYDHEDRVMTSPKVSHKLQ